MILQISRWRLLGRGNNRIYKYKSPCRLYPSNPPVCRYKDARTIFQYSSHHVSGMAIDSRECILSYFWSTTTPTRSRSQNDVLQTFHSSFLTRTTWYSSRINGVIITFLLHLQPNRPNCQISFHNVTLSLSPRGSMYHLKFKDRIFRHTLNPSPLQSRIFF